MQLTITTIAGEVFQLEVAEDMELENLLALCKIEAPSLANVPVAQFKLMHNGRPLIVANLLKKTLKDLQIVNGEMLMLGAGGTGAAAPNASGGASSQMALASQLAAQLAQAAGGASGGTAQSSLEQKAEQLRQAYANDPYTRSQIQQNNPTLAAALASQNKDDLLKLLREVSARQAEEERRRIRLLTADPFDIEAQQMIAEQIQQENIESTLESAYEHMPETFGQVCMLYVRCRVNGHEVKAFVDSGAQTTIMSVSCAQRCNIMRLVDRRFSGIAKGVGTQKIVGKIHMAQLEIESVFLPTAFTVLEDQSMDMLLGLDMLKRHQCIIDLKSNVLSIGTTGTQTAFLPENELPSHAKLNGGGMSPGRQVTEDSQLAEALEQSARENVGAGTSQQPEPPVSAAPNPALDRLVQMGFSRPDAQKALLAANGNADRAAIALLTKSLPKPT